MIIHVPKDSSQEPSTSSKYDFEYKWFLTHLYSCYRAEIRNPSQEWHIMMIHDVKDDPFHQDFIQEPSMPFNYDLEDRRFLTHF